MNRKRVRIGFKYCIAGESNMYKKLQFTVGVLILCLSLLAVYSSHATIRVLDKNPNNPNAYHTTQAAHDGSISGDTIVVVGYSSYYGNVVTNRPLHWIASGYMLSQLNPAPINANDAIIGYMDINSGSEGTVVEGLGTFTITVNANNVTIRMCWPSGITTNASNTLVERSFFLTYSFIVGSTASTTTIRNCYFTTLNVSSSSSGVWCYNNYISSVLSAYNTSLLNNYIVNTPTLHVSTSISYCMSGGDVGSSNGCVSYIPSANVITQSGSSNYDRYYQIHTGSPTIGAGSGGADIGPYGGSTPYVLSGRLPIPTLTSVSTTGHGDATNGIQVILSAQARN